MNFLHNCNIIHRDLKPDNLLVVSLKKDASVTIKITDFGTSKQIISNDFDLTLNIGTPIYMAPVLFSKNYLKLKHFFKIVGNSHSKTLFQKS